MTTTEDSNRPCRANLDVHLYGLLARASKDAVSVVMQAVSEWRDARSLHRMDHAALKDIGISRGDIEWVVRNGASDRRCQSNGRG